MSSFLKNLALTTSLTIAAFKMQAQEVSSKMADPVKAKHEISSKIPKFNAEQFRTDEKLQKKINKDVGKLVKDKDFMSGIFGEDNYKLLKDKASDITARIEVSKDPTDHNQAALVVTASSSYHLPNRYGNAMSASFVAVDENGDGIFTTDEKHGHVLAVAEDMAATSRYPQKAKHTLAFVYSRDKGIEGIVVEGDGLDVVNKKTGFHVLKEVDKNGTEKLVLMPTVEELANGIEYTKDVPTGGGDAALKLEAISDGLSKEFYNNFQKSGGVLGAEWNLLNHNSNIMIYGGKNHPVVNGPEAEFKKASETIIHYKPPAPKKKQAAPDVTPASKKTPTRKHH